MRTFICLIVLCGYLVKSPRETWRVYQNFFRLLVAWLTFAGTLVAAVLAFLGLLPPSVGAVGLATTVITVAWAGLCFDERSLPPVMGGWGNELDLTSGADRWGRQKAARRLHFDITPMPLASDGAEPSPTTPGPGPGPDEPRAIHPHNHPSYEGSPVNAEPRQPPPGTPIA